MSLRILVVIAQVLSMSVGALGIVWLFSLVPHMGAPPDDEEEPFQHPFEPEIDLDDVQTLDLVLFRGASMTSAVIRSFCKCSWTHVGIALRIRDRIYVLHSDTGNECFDFLQSRSNIDGVQMNLLDEYMEKYEGQCYIRRFRFASADASASQDLHRQLFEIINLELRGQPFAKSLPMMMRSAFGNNSLVPRLRETSERGRSFFCSEMVAYVLMRLGIIPESDIREFNPGHFAPYADCYIDKNVVDDDEWYESWMRLVRTIY